jgi:ATP-dependent DNA ligase
MKMIKPSKAKHVPHDDGETGYQSLWKDEKFINERFGVEKKDDGSRYTLLIDKETKLLSRRVSVVTKKYVDKTENCPHLTKVKWPKELWGTQLDGELVHPKSEGSHMTTTIMGALPEKAIALQKEHGYLKYRLFDSPQVCGEDISKLSDRKRREKLLEIIPKLQKYIKGEVIPRSPATEAKSMYEFIVGRGGEGVMLKDLDAPYGRGWYKVKKVKTWDVVIMGYEDPKETSEKTDGSVSETRLHKKGWIGAIIFGFYVNGELKKFGTCGGIPDAVLEELSKNKKKNIGRAIEIKAQERTKKGKFRHPRFVRFRDDKDATQCVDKE